MRCDDEQNEWRHGGSGFTGHDRGHFRGFGLKYWVLSIVSKEPSTGSMIMDKVERMSMGHWRPSPGHVYPLLEQLTSEGYLSVENKDGKKYYSVTDGGREILEGSWFPWRTMGGLSGFSGLEDAVRNIEILSDYILDNRERFTANADLKNRMEKAIERLRSI